MQVILFCYLDFKIHAIIEKRQFLSGVFAAENIIKLDLFRKTHSPTLYQSLPQPCRLQDGFDK
jgi:hypothetical protein